MTIIFATCDHQPLTQADDEPLARALTDLGFAVTPMPWTELDPSAVVDAWPIVLRSTWDYHRVPTMFAAWLDALDDVGRRVLNPVAIARQNIDKIYLRALGESGIAIPGTRWIDRPDPETVANAMQEAGWPVAVLKPRVGATAHGTHLVKAGMDFSDVDFGPARASGALLQEFVPEIRDRGEVSLVFAGREFSHAVSKRARDGEFRVQKDFGGRVAATTPSADVLALASRVMSTVPDDGVYARVDIVESAKGPLLMELELIEPELYFSIVPGSAERMARVIIDRLR